MEKENLNRKRGFFFVYNVKFTTIRAIDYSAVAYTIGSLDGLPHFCILKLGLNLFVHP